MPSAMRGNIRARAFPQHQPPHRPPSRGSDIVWLLVVDFVIMAAVMISGLAAATLFLLPVY
jgi:hypothetical protein